MDFTKLRAAAMKDGDDEEAVTVNTRALIDKVLARYSGEWTTLRELIQNAADAQATMVSIKFETLPSAHVPLSNTTNSSEILKHVLLNHTLRRLVVTNNGQSFGVNDWARLKRIAEGNPDETKIGAFGVGFYSVFADCEDPFVSSGPEAMAFYWKGNSLFTKKLQLPPEEANPNTSFVLDYRNTTTPMPNLLSIAQFLATSLTFVSLENIELWVDDWRIISLTKKVAPSVDIPLVKDVETKTKEGLMSVQSLDKESVQMDATFMNVVGWKPSIPSSVSKPGHFESSYGTSNNDVPSLRSFFSRLTTTKESRVKMEAVKEEKAMQEIVLEDLTALTTTNVFLRVTTARVKTSVSAQFASELERATKKPPPKTTKIAILTSSYDEAAASAKQNKVAKGVDVFSSVLPSKKPGGRIFIGFPTHQTTGAGLHLSAPSVIPTVERESIDLNARWVRTWNVEMLRVAGIMSRLAFANEMADLSAKVKQAAEAAGRGTRVSKEDIDKLMPEALHILKTFTFSDSTPAPMVSRIIEEAFWTAYKKPSIEMYSSKGVLSTTQVRLAVEDLSGFVDGIPVVPDELRDITFVNKLKDFGVITEVTFSDVKKELEAKALNQDQLVQFIGWAGRKAVQGEMDAPTINQLLDVTIATVGENEGQGGIITLGTIKNFLLPSKIPADDSLPLPPSTIPYQFTRASKINELQALGWDTLEIVPWLRFLIESAPGAPEEHNLTKSPKFAAQVLLIISKQWEPLSTQGQNTVISLLKPITIIPTKFGMKRPNEAFFASVKLFDDLPIVTGCPHIKEKFFTAIGVRKTVDLETIFKRLLPAEGSEKGEIGINKRNGHMEIIKYLASVADEIPSGDMVRLRASKICPAEAGPKGMESAKGTAELYPVNELFAPNSALRDLGLPILQWAGPPGSFRATSVEGRFLNLLGLRSFPSVPELINLMASNDELVRHKAMTYYIANHHINQYDSFSVGASRKAFLPIVSDSNRLVTPAECFTNEACAVLGFNILKRDLHIHASKFGVAKDPPIADCVQILINKPPPTRREAVTLFNYFAFRLGEIGPHSVVQLCDAKIVPVLPKNSKDLKYLTPRQCYIGNSPTYGEIFDFVDFGTDANLFLRKCGSKNEPSNLEIAAEVARSPARIYDIVGSTEKYLSLLRTLADDLSTLKRDKQLFAQMKSSQFLLAWQEVAAAKEKQSSKENEFDEEEPRIKTYRLAVPSDIVVSDEYNSFRLFSQSLICAPEEERLERFYLALGSRTVSSLVEQDLRIGSFSEKQQPAAMLQKQILERSKLFLHDVDPSTIRYDSRWLEKNFSVAVVSSISLRRSLRGTSLQHKENRTAAYKQDRTRGHILYITGTSIDTYQVGQSMCNLLLTRPTQQAMLTFESLLTLNLYQLRSRGYNVDRILRAKAAEQRVAEEERKKQLEQEQQRIQQQEEEWKKQGQMVQAAAKEDNRKPKSMPGAFGSDSPPQSPAPKRGRGLFSGLKERFGLDSGSMGEAQEQLQNFLGGGKNDTPPPPYEDGAKNQKRKETEQVSSPHAVQQNLLNAIQSSRAHDSSALFSPPSQQIIKEASEGSYCDSTPSQNITFLADASNGTRIFISKTATTPANTFLSENVTALNSFAVLLHEVGSVYGITPKALHIFYDESGSTIAFNSSGSIFCNYRFFNQLHRAKLESEGDANREGKTEAASYWWIVMAHELSHNLIKEHNAEHSFYTEMLVANYFPKMMAMANRFTAAPSRGSRQIQSESTAITSSTSSKNGETRSLLD